ncbi:MAG: class I SAM-dependent methyltransferase [Deltaproteobacteria bacterium]|nr:class I SAM-dependent methyltransferase [Deltaproteobacteria bacterium]
MSKLYPDSHVEIHGFMANHYDILLDAISLGLYRPFIRDAIDQIRIVPGDRILVLGAGTGRNACLMMEHLGKTGFIQAFDVGDEMIRQFKHNCAQYDNVAIAKQRIDEEFEIDQTFDKVFISFVLHGLPHASRLKVLENAAKALKPGGTFHLLDWDPTIKERNYFMRRGFSIVECPYATEFLVHDWDQLFKDAGFAFERQKQYFLKLVRILTVRKIS